MQCISSTISMACLLYLQCIHMLQHCHSRPKTLHFINITEKTSGLHVWPPCTTRKHGGLMVDPIHPSALLSMFDSYLIAVLIYCQIIITPFGTCVEQPTPQFIPNFPIYIP